MKLFFTTLLALLLGSTLLYAQQDTTFTTVKEETGTIEPQHYETQYDQAFGTKIPAKWMVKWDMSKLFSGYDERSVSYYTFQVSTGIERKITPFVSVGIDYSFVHEFLGYYNGAFYIPDESDLHIIQGSARWYYNMASKIKAGKSANNFSGNYVALQTETIIPSQDRETSQLGLTIRYGVQRRLFKRNFIDLSYGFGAYHINKSNSNSYPYSNPYPKWKLSLNQQFKVGLAQFFPKSEQAPVGGFCDILHCYDEKKSMLKVDLFNLVRINELSSRLLNMEFLPTVAYEHKLGASPFSMEVQAAGKANVFKYDIFSKRTGAGVHGYNGSVQAEIRWYYNMRKQILSGKSGNNLSGPFLAVDAGVGTLHLDAIKLEPYTSYTHSYDTDYHFVRTIWGFQQRIFDRGYAQFKVGIDRKWDHQQNIERPNFLTVKIEGLSYFTELKVGLAF